MRFLSEGYGPQEHVDIELGDLITLFVGPNNTGKSFIARGIYSILRSCRIGRCDNSSLAVFLLNSIMASEQDLWIVSRGFSGRFSLALEDKVSGFSVRIDYDRNRQNPLTIDVVGNARLIFPLYAPAHRIISYTLPYIFAVYASEFKDVLMKVVSQVASLYTGVAKDIPEPGVESTGFESDVLYAFTKSFISIAKPLIEQKPEIIKALPMAFSPTVLDVAVAIHVAEVMGIESSVREISNGLFPEVPYRTSISHGSEGYNVPEVPLHLLSSGMQQTLPILYLLNLALIKLKQGYKKAVIFIDEPEINLELLRQIRFVEMFLNFIYSVYREGREISIVIATHSDFIAYSITRWLAKKELRDLAKVYEFKSEGVEERKIDEYGEIYLETFSKALRKAFFEEEFVE